MNSATDAIRPEVHHNKDPCRREEPQLSEKPIILSVHRVRGCKVILRNLMLLNNQQAMKSPKFPPSIVDAASKASKESTIISASLPRRRSLPLRYRESESGQPALRTANVHDQCPVEKKGGAKKQTRQLVSAVSSPEDVSLPSGSNMEEESIELETVDGEGDESEDDVDNCEVEDGSDVVDNSVEDGNVVDDNSVMKEDCDVVDNSVMECDGDDDYVQCGDLDDKSEDLDLDDIKVRNFTKLFLP
jgi:hypothetical protein